MARHKSNKHLWLDRALVSTPYLALCLSEENFHVILRQRRLPKADYPPWLKEEHCACVHTFSQEGGRADLSVVCLDPKRPHFTDVLAVYATLAHEAVHVFQRSADQYSDQIKWCEEQAATFIGTIAERLMREYRRQTKGKRK